MLHIITQSPTQSTLPTLPDSEKDEILLFGDGVYWVLTEKLQRSAHALKDHCTARGIVDHPLLNMISYEEFVRLTEQHTPIATW